jgi:hypothetical protein
LPRWSCFPIYSAAFGGSQKPLDIESVGLIKAFARSIAKDRTKLLVVIRQAAAWGLEPAPNVLVFPGGQARKGSIRPYAETIFKRLGN